MNMYKGRVTSELNMGTEKITLHIAILGAVNKSKPANIHVAITYHNLMLTSRPFPMYYNGNIS
jgi:hypothetical protein